MKSLKRTLCLVLALVMVLGLFGIASATSFTDDDSIQYKEAVEVITGIGAINGMGDGTFAPKATITRAQAAVMVTRVALTAGVAADLTGVESSFTDVTVAGGFGWAIPSIEYMVKEGIVNGMGDGTFNPNGEINGYAVLKMLLCVLGYGAKDEYVGNQWTLQVAVDAAKKDNNLTAGRTSKELLSGPATREEVALYCFNALGARTVSYNKLYDSYDKTTADSVYLGETGNNTNLGTTLADDIYGIKAVVTGVVTKNGSTDANCKKDGKTFVNALAGGDDAPYVADTGLDLIGHYVKVYYKTDATVGNVAYAVVDAGKAVSVPKNITTAAAYKAAFGAADVDFKDNAIGFSAATMTKDINTAGAGLVPGSAANAGTYILVTDTATGKDEIVSYIPDAAYRTSAVTTYEAPTSTTEGKLVITGAPDITIPKVGETDEAKLAAYALYNIYATPAAKDIVMIQQTGSFTTITKANIVGMGTISEVNTAAKTFVSNGTTYSVDDTNGAFVSMDPLNLFNKALVGNNNTYAFFGNAQGKVVAIATVDSSTDKGIVYPVMAYQKEIKDDYGAVIYLNMVQCVDMEGNVVTYTVGKATKANEDSDLDSDFSTLNALCYNKLKDDISAYAANTAAVKLCKVTTTYNETLKMDLATLTPTIAGVVNNGITSAPGSANKTGKITDSGKDLYFDANTVSVFVTGKGSEIEVKVLKGVQALPDARYSFYATLASSTATTGTINYIVVNGEPVDAPVTSGIMYVKAVNGTNPVTYTNAQNQPATAYKNTVFVDGAKTEVLLASDDGTTFKDAATNGITEGFYKFTVDAQGIYSLTPYTAAGVTVSTGKFVSSVFTSETRQVISTAAAGNNVYGTADLTAADMTGIKIVDVDYELAADKTGMTNHNTLALINGGEVAYTYSTDAATGAQKINGIVYYVGAPNIISVSLTASGMVLKNPASGGWTDDNGVITASITGGTASRSIAWTIAPWSGPTAPADSAFKAVNGATTSDTQIDLVTAAAAADGKVTQAAGKYTVKCVVSENGYFTGTATVDIDVKVSD